MVNVGVTLVFSEYHDWQLFVTDAIFTVALTIILFDRNESPQEVNESDVGLASVKELVPYLLVLKLALVYYFTLTFMKNIGQR
jgi:uncharacterized membrane protein